MRLRVDLQRNKNAYPDQVIAVAVFHGSVVGALLNQGASEVWVAPSIRSARLLARPGDVLLGEEEGMPPEGFHHSLSLRDLLKTDFSGQRAVVFAYTLCKALAPTDTRVMLGYFRNARAVVEANLDAREEVALVCASDASGEPSLGNILAAGFLAKRIQQLAKAEHLEGAMLASSLLRAFPDPQEGLFASAVGQRLYRMGRSEDLALASLISVEDVIPELKEVRVLDAKEYGLSKNRPVYRFGRRGE
ncbi:putative 2-phosphosulfolactate phosphatase [Calidithermus terrae]|uniref:Probable 2-phosphosulfolactate phosphatase n=1 Tax=Calidithermus terrae TaxID=1408545 RepID=A0A399F4H6_9DEIN|nr:2-phosphosulfolactate phosphatase [Calidithermus terrae]RIH90960.1 putative 2-phosphosulfolactate phosphatase [Calidithermus terrae]